MLHHDFTNKGNVGSTGHHQNQIRFDDHSEEMLDQKPTIQSMGGNLGRSASALKFGKPPAPQALVDGVVVKKKWNLVTKGGGTS